MHPLKNLQAIKMYHIIGASGHAKVVIETLELCLVYITGITDSNPEITTLIGYSVSSRLPTKRECLERKFIIGIGSNSIRKKVSELNELKDAIDVHPSANLSKRISIGWGSVIMAGVSINSGCEISEHCIINTNASVDHDCKIHSFVYLSPNSALAGGVEIGEGSHVGLGASVIQNVKIGKWATIGAGA